jgi:hypothetical protein
VSADAIGMALDGAFKLGEMIADEISQRTGIPKKVSFEIAHEVTTKYVAAERAKVTAARAKAKAKAKAASKR